MSTLGKSPIKNAKTKKTPKIIRKSPNSQFFKFFTGCATIPAKTRSGGDRFIPSRSTTHFDVSRYKIFQEQNKKQDRDKSDNIHPVKREKQRLMGENLLGGDINNMRVLSYQIKVPASPDGYQNLRTLYSQIETPANIRALTRYISKRSDTILAAPKIINNYYLNLVDWSSKNILALALDSDLWLWDAETETVKLLIELEEDYICSVAWSQEGSYLAVGTTIGNTEIWDCSKMEKIRVMNGDTRVNSLSWNSHILSSGCRLGKIMHYDVRQNRMISTINAHNQEICGLKWSPNGRYLASGGADDMLQIWSLIAGRNYSQTQPIYSFNHHQDAVKALAWCPWQNNILASGGGIADQTIRFWNCNTGACLNSVDTKSQVCDLLWSTNYKEIISGHGFPQNPLIIWTYPTMTKVAQLAEHTDRVLHLAMSPDGTTVLSASADETLRLWKCFQVDINKKKECSETKSIEAKAWINSIKMIR